MTRKLQRDIQKVKECYFCTRETLAAALLNGKSVKLCAEHLTQAFCGTIKYNTVQKLNNWCSIYEHEYHYVKSFDLSICHNCGDIIKS